MLGAQIFLQYVEWIGQGEVTRKHAAEHFGVHKSTATYHLEKGVSEGYLERVYAWTDANQTGWGYRAVGTVERMFDDYGARDDYEQIAREANDITPYL